MVDEGTLRQRQALPLEAKVELAKIRIREWSERWDGDVYVSYSGGKDSTVLLHLARQVCSDVPAMFVDTGLEFPELRRAAIHTPGVVTVRPSMTYRDVIDRYGYPVISKQVARMVHNLQRASLSNEDTVNLTLTGYTRSGKYSPFHKIPDRWRFLASAPFKISGFCCDILKKRPAHAYERETGRRGFIGTRADESNLRMRMYKLHGCNGPVGSAPLSVWSEQDILQYIKLNGLQVPSVYGELVETDSGLRFSGEQRTGCMFCLFGIMSDPFRFDRLRRTHPKQHAYCMDVLGVGRVLDYLRGKDLLPPMRFYA